MDDVGKESQDSPATLIAEPLNQHLRAGIELLSRAYAYALHTGRDAWEYAIELSELQRQGLSTCDIRWLIAQDYAQHAVEMSCADGAGRTFRQADGAEFCQRSCFILTADARRAFQAGSAKLECGTAPNPLLSDETNPSQPCTPPEDVNSLPLIVANGKPAWDGERKELRLGETLVKRFKWPAINQETILCVFEEDGWPARIDDPLPPVPEQEPKRRLHDTIKCLNRNQLQKAIRFRGDGTGEGVIWEVIATSEGGLQKGND